MRTPPNEAHHVVTSSETGHTEYRKLLTEQELRFAIRLALMRSTAFTGTPRRGREEIHYRIADDIVAHFRLSNTKVFGGIAESGPVQVGGRKHLWKTDEEVEREGD